MIISNPGFIVVLVMRLFGPLLIFRWPLVGSLLSEYVFDSLDVVIIAGPNGSGKTAIRTPDLKEPTRRGRLRVTKRFDARVLNVFYRETGSSIIFVTAYWRKQ